MFSKNHLLTGNMKFFYEDVLKAVGEFGPWQVKMIFFLWVPMFMWRMQWTTTDFMGLEPKELFCEYNGCTDYQEVLVKGNIKDKLENYTDIFPNTTKYYGENTSTFAAELSIDFEEEELKKDMNICSS